MNGAGVLERGHRRFVQIGGPSQDRRNELRRSVEHLPAARTRRDPLCRSSCGDELRLELPLIGLSSARTVTYSTDNGHPLLAGAVTPPGATLYVEDPDGNRTAVNPRADGRFEIRAKLSPGGNLYRFIAAKLGDPTLDPQLAAAVSFLDGRLAQNPTAPPPKS